MRPIYHVATQAQWQAAQAAGHLTAESLTVEGFIHCSQAHQALGVLARFFDGVDGLLMLCIDAEQLGAALRYEPPAEGVVGAMDAFPHVYAAIPLAAIVAAGWVLRDDNERHLWPAQWESIRTTQTTTQGGQA